MMERVKGSVNESASIPNYTNCSPWKRSRRPTRSAYFSGIQSNLKRSKENPSLPPPSIERSVYFVDSCASSAWSFDWGSAFTERAVDAFRACPKFAPLGVRHLCERRCYLRAYEPCRKWHALRCALVRAGAPTRILNGWSVRMDRTEGHRHPWRISYVSPEGDILPSRKAALEALGLSQCSNSPSPPRLSRSTLRERRRSHLIEGAVESGRPQLLGPTYLLKDARTGTFPPSPFGLIEELLHDDPWKLLLGCIMLNQTTRSQMDPVLFRFLNRFPTAATVAAASIEEVKQVVAPLGLHNRRPVAIIRFSEEYLQKPWNDPKELYWIGKYASDAFKIFVKKDWCDVQPDDHALNWWIDWKRGTEIGQLSTYDGSET